MKKILIASSLFFAITFAGNTVVKAQEATEAKVENPNAADFKFEKDIHEFGTIKQGESVTYEFKFSNSGKEPLIITEAHGSCGCTVPEWPKEPIKKGGTGVIKVTFNSAGKSGVQDKTVTITSNAKSPTKVLHMKGNVDVPATAAPTPTVTPAKQ